MFSNYRKKFCCESTAIYFVQGALLLSNVMAGIDSTNVNTALPAIIADLHGLRLMAWIVAVFLLGTAKFQSYLVKNGERFGNKRVYQMTTALFYCRLFTARLKSTSGFDVLQVLRVSATGG